MIISKDLSDAAALTELGRRIAGRRLDRNLTQAQFAREAGVSKRTVERVESGQSVQLTNWLRVLRALDLLASLETLLPASVPSPMAELRQKGKQRRRASSKPKSDPESSGDWSWGDA